MLIYLATPKLSVIKKLNEHFPGIKPNILLSYGSPNIDTYNFLTTDRSLVGKIFLDSGTWTLNQNKTKYGQIITINTYESYLNSEATHCDYYFNFDECYYERTAFKINSYHQEKLEAAGFNPIYVIHNTKSIEVNYCINRKFDYVSVGSGALKKKQSTADIVNHLHNNRIKTHLLGLTKYDYLKDIPAYSCDSSSWTQAAVKSDAILFWNLNEEKQDKIHIETMKDACKKGHFCYSNYPFKKELDDYLWNNLKLTYCNLLGKQGPENRKLVNMLYFIELEKRLTENHIKLGFPY